MFSSFVSLLAKLAYFVFKKRVQFFPIFLLFFFLFAKILGFLLIYYTADCSFFSKSQKVLVKISMLGTCILYSLKDREK